MPILELIPEISKVLVNKCLNVCCKPCSFTLLKIVRFPLLVHYRKHTAVMMNVPHVFSSHLDRHSLLISITINGGPFANCFAELLRILKRVKIRNTLKRKRSFPNHKGSDNLMFLPINLFTLPYIFISHFQ